MMENKAFCLSVNELPDIIYLDTETGSFSLTSDTDCFFVQDVTVRCKKEEECLSVSLQADQTKVRFVTMRWEMPVPSNMLMMGDTIERGYGDLEWRGMVPDRFFPWYFLMTDGTTTYGCGVKTAPRALCWWQVDSDGVMLCMDVRNGDGGVWLNGRCLEVAEIVTRISEESPYAVAVQLCRKMCRQAIFPQKPVYGINDWYYAYGQSDRDSILRDTKLLVELAPTDNTPYSVIDDGWQIGHTPHDNGGPWNEANEKFKDMEELAKDIKKLGAIPGIWFRPLLHNHQDLPKEMYLSGHDNLLDISNPDVLARIAEDIRRFNRWGYRLIKYDFTTYDILGRWGFQMWPKAPIEGLCFQDHTQTNAELIRRLYETIYHAATSDTIILGCNCISHLGVGTMHVYRAGDDTSGVDWQRTRKMGVNTLAFRLPPHHIFYDVDADCIGVTGGIPWELNKEWLHLLQNSGTPLFVSADADKITDEQREALRSAYAQSAKQSDMAEPLDWLYTICPTQWKQNDEIVRYRWYDKKGFM